MSESKTNKFELTKKDLWQSWLWSIPMESGCSTTKKEAPGFTLGLVPIIEKFYNTKEEKAAAYLRHQHYFLTEGRMATFILGISIAMEQKLAESEEFDPESIVGLKVALMGPLAGIGDSLIHGTLRPIMAGIACSLIIASNYTSVFGSVLFWLVMATTVVVVRYFGVFTGYRGGMNFVKNLQEGGALNRLTKYAAIAAFTVCGALVPSLVRVVIPLQYASEATTIKVQDVLNGIMPGLVPLLFTGLIYYLIDKRKISPMWVMGGIMVFAVLAVYLGVLA